MAHVNTEPNYESWGLERQRRLLDLLSAMAKHLGLKYSRADLEAGIYAPVYHGTVWYEQEMIRKGVVALLEGKPLIVENAGASTEPGKKAAKLFLEVLEGKRPIRIAAPEAPKTLPTVEPGPALPEPDDER